MKDTINAEAETSGPHTQPRIAYHQASPKAVRPLWDLEEYVRNSGLEPGLIELVKLRASQINGCAYCIDMHTKDARARGEPSSNSMSLAFGPKLRFTATAKGRHWRGPRR